MFLYPQEKHKSRNDIDKIISAEILDKESNSRLYEAVKNYMMHGPCGAAKPNSPCMHVDRCSKYFPKFFSDETTIDEDGYPLYKRRDDKRTIEIGGTPLDNKFVVPYNAELLLRYDSHINVVWCNQNRAIKYLFKYINKGNDRITKFFYQGDNNGENGEMMDEINMYYSCRYVSPCEAVWRIFGFPITHREPAVERLSLHLPGEQSVIFTDDDPIDDIVKRCDADNYMFLQWMKDNK